MRKAKILNNKDHRKTIEFVCDSDGRRWEALSIDKHGIRLTDAEQKFCPSCGERGRLTGLVY